MDLRAAASRGDERAVKTLLDGGIVDTENWHLTRSPLSLAAGNGYTGVVRLLVEKGKFDPGEVDEKDRTALSWAAGRGHKGVVKFLLAREDKNVDCIDEDGWTPLSWASGNGFLVVVKLLLEKEADVNSKDRAGRTPLSWAAAEGHKNIVKILLAQANIDVENDIDKKERTPFLLAAAKGKTTHRDIMGRILAKSRGCLNKADENGRTALSWAAGNGAQGESRYTRARQARTYTLVVGSRIWTPQGGQAIAGHGQKPTPLPIRISCWC
jgi:ankyrin repeat protein